MGRRSEFVEVHVSELLAVVQIATVAVGVGIIIAGTTDYAFLPGRFNNWMTGTLAVIVLVIVSLDVDVEDEDPLALDLRKVGRGISWLVTVAIIVVMVAIAPRSIADGFARKVRTGGELELQPLPGIALVRIDRVRATTVDDSPVSKQVENGACLSLLGSGGGTVVLYHAERQAVVRVPESQVTLESPCS